MVVPIHVFAWQRFTSAGYRINKQSLESGATVWIEHGSQDPRNDSFVLVQLIQPLLNDVHHGLEFLFNGPN